MKFNFFRNKKRGVPPHTWYPEILHWKTDDRINCWNIAQALSAEKFDWGTYHKYVDKGTASGQHVFSYRSVDQHGKIYLEDDEGDLVEFHFFKFIKYARNETLKSRKVESRVVESRQYMELMDNFQQAFNELQEADEHPKRLGDGSKINES